MALDGLVLHAVTKELQACVGGRINKIHQPSEHDVVMQLRAQGVNLRLLLSANPTYPRIHLTGEQFTNPSEAPMFCMLLRKHCEGGTIERIEQLGNERILKIHIRQRDELGDLSVKTIIVEIMGRHSNLILIDPASGTIIDGIHHVTPAISSFRVIMPGVAYTSPPEQNKANPFLATPDSFLNCLAPDNQETAEKPQWEQKLVASFSGLSPLAAKEIVHRSGVSILGISTFSIEEIPPISEAFFTLLDELKQSRIRCAIVEEGDSGKAFFAPYDLTHIAGEVRYFETISDCLEHYYGDKAERDTVKQRASDLIKLLQNEKNKNEKKLDKLNETLEDAKDADRYRILGELLTASLHTVSKGDKQVQVTNYYDEQQRLITIVLDPLLTPSENAQRYYKKYTKTKNSLIAVTEQIEQTKTEILYLQSLLGQLDAVSLRDIEEIREELIEQGYLRKRNKKSKNKDKKTKKQIKPQLACYESPEGILIFVGKNNTQNDYLTNRFAESNDIWLHTKDIPGSHVVIRSPQCSDETLHQAAQLAAYFSGARQSSAIPVDYTLVKHVHKPNGAKPGFVIYDRQKTLYVTPNEDAIKSWKITLK
jgi:predicted ribosome quality control (RQC) complex YloA/Tae2 family protein